MCTLDESVREKARLESLSLPHAGDWLNTAPLTALGLHLRPAEFVPIALASMSTPVRVTALHVAKKVTSWEITLLPVFEVETESPGMTYFVI